MRGQEKGNKRAALRRVKGFITAHVLIASGIAVVLLLGLVIFIANMQSISREEVARQQSIQAAETGIYFYGWYLAHNLDGKNAQQIKDFWENGGPIGVDPAYEEEVKDFEGHAYGKYQVEVTPPAPNSTIVIVKSTGWTYRHPEIKRSIRVRFRRPSWSEFAVLGNDMMRFGDGTVIYGPVHSNNGIHFDGVANNKVTSSVETYLDPETNTIKPGVWTSKSDESAVFLAGKEFPVAARDFNGVTSDLAYMKSEAQAEGIYLGNQYHEENVCAWYYSQPECCNKCTCYKCNTVSTLIEGYHITLRTDDKVEIREVYDYEGDVWGERHHMTYRIEEESAAQVIDMPANGLIYVENNVWVDGQVDSAWITIASAKLNSIDDTNIYINDDILYTNKDGSDVIGLIAENSIDIGLYSENDLEIDAAILAQKGRIGRDPYNTGNSTEYYKRDRITIYGAMATNERYGFTYTDENGQQTSGYTIRNVYFDNYLLYNPPPFFPTGGVYQLDLWEEL